ncbi:MAG: hypothetical protein WAM14_27330 [Candidatus Nitrosopolaris sp.]
MLLSFSIMLLFTTYDNPAHAQLTKTLGVKITSAAVNTITIKQEQHGNGFTPLVFASPSSSLKNLSSALSTTSSLGPTQIMKSSSTAATVPSNNPNRGSNSQYSY